MLFASGQYEPEPSQFLGIRAATSLSPSLRMSAMVDVADGRRVLNCQIRPPVGRIREPYALPAVTGVHNQQTKQPLNNDEGRLYLRRHPSGI